MSSTNGQPSMRGKAVKMNDEILSEIKSMIPYVLVAVLAVGGYYGFKQYRENQRRAQSQAFANAQTTDDLEAAAAQFGERQVGPALKLKLAKSYYDESRYEEALSLYDELAAKAPDGFADVPVVGRAQCLEALTRYDEALSAYRDFAAANPSNYLALTAKLGAVRVTALKGDRTAATNELAALQAEFEGDQLARLQVNQLEDLIKRMR